ncbi:MAG: rRNA maturation RNase YbeY [Lachnospiraceae bacterium]|nr:rRNA maturation RNase YbeY [Lachnospiraceae bacterium]
MTLYFEDKTGAESDLPFEEIFNTVAGKVLESENCPFSCEISLSLVNSEEIQELNREFRGIDKETDVLSFPLVDYSSPGDFDGIDEDSPEYFNPETKDLMLGDIVICLGRVYSQAEAYGHSPKREFAFLIAHSMLHLLGFDHEEKADEELMFSKQEEVLSSLGIVR